jgi:tetratricopeptide (TPR) repeat protein
LLAGKPPFEGEDAAAVLAKHASAKTPTLAELAPERTFTPRLEHVVGEALAKDPDRRFASASEMAAAIDVARVDLDPLPPTKRTTLGLGTTSPRAPAPKPRREPELYVGGPREHRTELRDAIALALIAIVIFVSVIAMRGDRSATSTSFAGTPRPPVAASANPLVDRALEKLNAGDPAAATEILESALAQRDERMNARAFLTLGHARFAAGRRADGVAAYERALALDRDLGSDTRLRQNLLVAFDSRDVVAGIVALEVAARISPPLTDSIAAQAANGTVPEIRQRARAIAERDGFEGSIDPSLRRR